MKTIGLIGGISWESTIEYYRIINETIREKAGKQHSAKILMNSVDFEDVEYFVKKQDFKGLLTFISNIAIGLEKSGADCILICANTMHLLAEDVQKKLNIPLIHIVDATAEVVKEKKMTKVGLLGTTMTMEHGFYKDGLKNKHRISTIIPAEDERQFIQKVIFTELFAGLKKPESKNKFLKIIDRLAKQGAEGIILGCTEIPLLIQQSDTNLMVFDTMDIHARAAVKFALS